jgi:hypothetical protein
MGKMYRAWKEWILHKYSKCSSTKEIHLEAEEQTVDRNKEIKNLLGQMEWEGSATSATLVILEDLEEEWEEKVLISISHDYIKLLFLLFL